MKSFGLNPTQFADEIGVQRSSISHILSGRNNPSLDIVTKILNRFKEVDSNWLILGKGSLFSKSEEKISKESNIETSEHSESNKKTFSNSLFDDIQEDITPKHDLNKIGDLERKIELLEKKYKEKDVLSSNDDEKLPEIKTTDSNFNNVIAENLVVNEENNTKETINTILTPAVESKTKHIKRLIVFYSDNTFEELPKN
jgi:transcriptional regulator with XRE-family HTH domain